MKLKYFYFSLLPIETFLKKWDEIINSKDDKKIEQFCHKEKTKYFIKEILNSRDKKHKDFLYERVYNLLRTNQLKSIKDMLNAGLDINYQALTFVRGLAFGIDNNKTLNHETNRYQSNYDAILVMNTFLEYGLDVNVVQNDESLIGELLSSILSEKNPKSFFDKFTYQSREISFDDKDEENFLTTNKSLKALYMILHKEINLKKEGMPNIIPQVIQIRSKTLIDIILNIKSLDMNYLLEGIEKSKKNSMYYSEEMYEYLMIQYEKKRLNNSLNIIEKDIQNNTETKKISRRKI
jgi:hypothetical protein